MRRVKRRVCVCERVCERATFSSLNKYSAPGGRLLHTERFQPFHPSWMLYLTDSRDNALITIVLASRTWAAAVTLLRAMTRS